MRTQPLGDNRVSTGVKPALAISALAVALSSVPATASAARCPSGGKTVVRTSDGRVWGVTPKSQITRYYGCAFRIGTVIRLDPPRGQLIAYKPKVRIAGTAVAYEAMSFDLKPYRVIVRSLRSGRIVHSASSNRSRSAEGHTGPVMRIVLERSGSVAWTTSSDCICEETVPSGYEVHAIGRTGGRRILDSGKDVDAASLRLIAGGTQVTWMNGTTSRSATLN
jgi:hypothetical protein